MKTKARFILLAASLCMFAMSVYAEAGNDSYIVASGAGNISVVTDCLTSETDYSSLLVSVYKDWGGMVTTLYHGALGDYADGSLANVDFSEINFLVNVDDDGGIIYIIPENNTQSNVELSLQSSGDGFFKLDDAISENVTQGIPKKIYNINLLPDSYVEYMSELGNVNNTYDESGGSPISVDSYDYKITAINLRDNEGEESDCISNNGVLQSVTVDSNGTGDDVILAIAEYNGYTLRKLESYSINPESASSVITTNYSLSNITADTSIKLFVWDAYWGTNPKASPVMLFTENDMNLSVNYMYNNVYTEKTVNPGQTMTAQVYAKSTKWWPQDINLYFALYNADNKLINIAYANGRIISNGNYQYINAGIPLGNELPEGFKIKTFIWENQTMKPYPVDETIIANGDYHANSIAGARFVDMTKAVTGKIDSESDIDCIKFVPTATQDYLIQLSGSNLLGINLYDSSGTLVSSDKFYLEGTGTVIGQNLAKGKEYYIEITGQAQQQYTLTVTPNNKSDDNMFVSADGIEVSGNDETTAAITAKLLTKTGNIISSQNFAANAEGDYSANLRADITSGEYYFIISKGNAVQKMWCIKAVVNNCVFNAEKNEHCIVPIAVSGAETLENVRFSVYCNADDFELYDACDLTDAIEKTAVEISEKQLEIIKVQPSCIVFKSTKTNLTNEDNIINTVKLEAKKNSLSTVYVCAYIAE